MNANIIYIDLHTLLPDVTGASDACVRRLIGSLSAHDGLTDVSAEAAAGQPAKLCVRYDPHVLTPSRIQEMAEGLSSSLRRYLCRSIQDVKPDASSPSGRR